MEKRIKEITLSQYQEWLLRFVCGEKDNPNWYLYSDTLEHLYNIEFKWSIPMDENRAADGVSLRHRFIFEKDYKEDEELVLKCLEGPCSVLEMMIALAIRCEEDIMDDPSIGNRTSQWFWGMMVSLGLGSMQNRFYDIEKVDAIVERFLNREYEPNGKGGLFTLKHCDTDLRNVEIWHQLLWYLNTIT